MQERLIPERFRSIPLDQQCARRLEFFLYAPFCNAICWFSVAASVLYDKARIFEPSLTLTEKFATLVGVKASEMALV